jgi:hypothetical protein
MSNAKDIDGDPAMTREELAEAYRATQRARERLCSGSILKTRAMRDQEHKELVARYPTVSR